MASTWVRSLVRLIGSAQDQVRLIREHLLVCDSTKLTIFRLSELCYAYMLGLYARVYGSFFLFRDYWRKQPCIPFILWLASHSSFRYSCFWPREIIGRKNKVGTPNNIHNFYARFPLVLTFANILNRVVGRLLIHLYFEKIRMYKISRSFQILVK